MEHSSHEVLHFAPEKLYSDFHQVFVLSSHRLRTSIWNHSFLSYGLYRGLPSKIGSYHLTVYIYLNLEGSKVMLVRDGRSRSPSQAVLGLFRTQVQSSTRTLAVFPYIVLVISPPQTTFMDVPSAFIFMNYLYTDCSLCIRQSVLCLLFVFKKMFFGSYNLNLDDFPQYKYFKNISIVGSEYYILVY